MTEVFAGILILVMMLVLYYFGISFFEAMEHLSSLKDKYKNMELKTKWAHDVTTHPKPKNGNRNEMEENSTELKETATGIKKDVVAIWSFVLGLASIPFAFMGIIPLVALVLGIWGITRTKEENTGRWMAVTGTILGAVYLVSNAYMNGHFG